MIAVLFHFHSFCKWSTLYLNSWMNRGTAYISKWTIDFSHEGFWTLETPHQPEFHFDWPIFLVACSDSISHYVCPSVGPSITHLLFSLFDHAWGPQSHCLGQSSCFWSHWSQFQMNSLRNFKKSKNFQKFKIQKSEVLGQRMCSKCLSMLSQHWSPP